MFCLGYALKCIAPLFSMRTLRVNTSLYTDRQLQLLRCAHCWYVDGTFYVVRRPFPWGGQSGKLSGKLIW